MNSITIGIFIVILVYLVMMVAIGIFYSKKNNDVNDFCPASQMSAGQQLGWRSALTSTGYWCPNASAVTAQKPGTP